MKLIAVLVALAVVRAEESTNDVVTIDSQNFASTVGSGGPWLIEFYAPWCDASRARTDKLPWSSGSLSVSVYESPSLLLSRALSLSLSLSLHVYESLSPSPSPVLLRVCMCVCV